MYMWLFALLVPAIMIFFGRMFKKEAPGEINLLWGYRTTLSMKNRDTWEFAHKCIGTFWVPAGLVTLVVSLIPAFFLLNADLETVCSALGIVILLQLIPLGAGIAYTEKQLHKTFNKDGSRRQ